VAGCDVAERPIDVLDAVADPPAAPEFENGAEFVARTVLTDLRDPDPYVEPSTVPAPADPDGVPASGGRSLVAVPTLAVVCVATAATALSPSRIGRRAGSRAVRLAGTACDRCRHILYGLARSGCEARDGATTAVSLVTDGVRATSDRTRRGAGRVAGVLGTVRAVGAASADRAASTLGATGRELVERCRDPSIVPSIRS